MHKIIRKWALLISSGSFNELQDLALKDPKKVNRLNSKQTLVLFVQALELYRDYRETFAEQTFLYVSAITAGEYQFEDVRLKRIRLK